MSIINFDKASVIRSEFNTKLKIKNEKEETKKQLIIAAESVEYFWCIRNEFTSCTCPFPMVKILTYVIYLSNQNLEDSRNLANPDEKEHSPSKQLKATHLVRKFLNPPQNQHLYGQYPTISATIWKWMEGKCLQKTISQEVKALT